MMNREQAVMELAVGLGIAHRAFTIEQRECYVEAVAVLACAAGVDAKTLLLYFEKPWCEPIIREVAEFQGDRA